MSLRALAAPLHLRTREDEYSFVLQAASARCSSTTSARTGPATSSSSGNQWHTLWNAGDEPCRILEIISPAGFEQFFRELDGLGETGLKGRSPRRDR